jgi:hypothetical protein
MKYYAIVTFSLLAGATWGQAPAPAGVARAQVAGTVAAIDAGAKQISIKTDKGEAVAVSIGERSFLRRLPPGETDTKKAVPVELSAVNAGDRVVAIGQTSADQKTFEARTVYIMTKADVAAVHQKEQEDWQRRGVAGLVASLDPAAKSFTIKTGPRVTTVQLTDKTEILRYALDSAELADARPASLSQMRVGDEVHVLGNHSEDGASVQAEKVVSGSFKQIAATISSVNAQAGELQVKDLASKKALSIRVRGDTVVRKLEPQMAAMLARRYQGGGAGRGAGGEGAPAPAGDGRGPGGDGGGRAALGRGPGAGGFGRGGMRGGGGGDIKQMLDRLPATPLTDLKAGDAIMVSTTEGTDGTHLTAITLLAGVEPLLTASPNSTRDIMSGWNLGGGGGGEGN